MIRLPGHRENLGDGGVGFQPVVSDESAGGSGLGGGESAGRDPASIPLDLHEGGHGLQVDGYAFLTGELRREFDREAERVMEVEHFLRVKSSALE